MARSGNPLLSLTLFIFKGPLIFWEKRGFSFHIKKVLDHIGPEIIMCIPFYLRQILCQTLKKVPNVEETKYLYELIRNICSQIQVLYCNF